MNELRADEGLLAEFATGEALHQAAARLRDGGFERLDAFTPYPLHDLEAILGGREKNVTRLAGAAAFVGAALGYFLQWLMNAYLYPLDVGGRPPHSPLAFLLATFETGVLFGGVAAFLAVLGLSGLPRLWRPIFEIDGFERASVDRFWLHVAATDPAFDWVETRDTLLTLSPLRVVSLRTRS